MTRLTCECLQEGRNQHIPSRNWPEPGNVWLYSLPFSIKQVWILTQAEWFFGTLIHCLLSVSSLQIKSLSLDLTHWFIGLSYCKQYELGLGNTWTGGFHPISLSFYQLASLDSFNTIKRVVILCPPLLQSKNVSRTSCNPWGSRCKIRV